MIHEQEIGGLRCGDVMSQLDDYLAGELAPDSLAKLQAHVSGCENCARFGGEYATLVNSLRAQRTAAAATDDQLRWLQAHVLRNAR